MTDHKPLLNIFSQKTLISPRIEKWVLILQSYDYKLIYVAGKEQIADFFSRVTAVVHRKCDSKDEIGVYFIVERQLPKALKLSEYEKKF